MKSIISCILFASVFCICSNSSLSQTNPNSYELVWEDDFDGTSLDLTKWKYRRGAWGGGTQQCYIEESISVSNGTLNITAEHSPGYVCFDETKDFTSGFIRTRDLHFWTFGYFEARVKLPSSDSTWPAFWTLPQNDDYGPWPQSGEIDIFDHKGHDDSGNRSAAHWGNSTTDRQQSKVDYSVGDVTQWHNYGVEWSLGEIKFFVDGQLVHTVNNFDEPNATQHPGPFDIENYLILNMAVGGDYLDVPYNDANNSINQLPATMMVDWVRVYQKDTSIANCEKLYNGAFANNGEGWFIREFFDASGTFNNGFILIDNPGTATWHLALRQEGFMLESGKSYEVNFEAYTEDVKDVSIIISNIDGTQYHYEPYSFTGGSLENYSFQFTMNAPTDVNTVFNFNVGGDFNWVAVSNFSLKELNCLPCTPILDINNQTIISGTYFSGDQINSNGVVITNDEVFYRSNMIKLNSNFEVKQGGSFEATIDPCGN